MAEPELAWHLLIKPARGAAQRLPQRVKVTGSECVVNRFEQPMLLAAVPRDFQHPSANLAISTSGQPWRKGVRCATGATRNVKRRCAAVLDPGRSVHD